MSLNSLNFNVKRKLNNINSVSTVNLPIKPKAVNTVNIYYLCLPLVKNAVIKLKTLFGDAVQNYTFSINGNNYTTDTNGVAYVYLKEEQEETLNFNSPSYLQKTHLVTRPLEIDQGYFEEEVVLRKYKEYRIRNKKGTNYSEYSNVAILQYPEE